MRAHLERAHALLRGRFRGWVDSNVRALQGVKHLMTPENQQAFERSMDMLDSSIKEMRRVAHNMMPEALVKFGLDTAMRDFCDDVSRSGDAPGRRRRSGFLEHRERRCRRRC